MNDEKIKQKVGRKLGSVDTNKIGWKKFSSKLSPESCEILDVLKKYDIGKTDVLDYVVRECFDERSLKLFDLRNHGKPLFENKYFSDIFTDIAIDYENLISSTVQVRILIDEVDGFPFSVDVDVDSNALIANDGSKELIQFISTKYPIYHGLIMHEFTEYIKFIMDNI